MIDIINNNDGTIIVSINHLRYTYRLPHGRQAELLKRKPNEDLLGLLFRITQASEKIDGPPVLWADTSKTFNTI